MNRKYLTRSDAELEFVETIRNNGIAITEPDRIYADGQISRFHVAGDRRGTRNGWAILFDDEIGMNGVYGTWRSGYTGTWRSRDARTLPSKAERKRLRAAMQAAKQQRNIELQKRAKRAAVRAEQILAQAQPADPDHPYLQRKCVRPHGIRQSGARLVIPLHDANGRLWSLEYIAPDGRKRFLKGGRKKGHFYLLGMPGKTLLIAEGFATAASVHEATGHAVAVAFDAGNLEPVARALRLRYPFAKIIIAADNDTGNPDDPDNVGVASARRAAAAVGGSVAFPPVKGDFNDLACRGDTR